MGPIFQSHLNTRAYLCCHIDLIVTNFSDERNEELVHMADFSKFIVGHPWKILETILKTIHTYFIFKPNYCTAFLIIISFPTNFLNNYFLS